jgi:hypothetical protein
LIRSFSTLYFLGKLSGFARKDNIVESGSVASAQFGKGGFLQEPASRRRKRRKFRERRRMKYWNEIRLKNLDLAGKIEPEENLLPS